MNKGGVFLQDRNIEESLPVTARFKAFVCRRTFVGIAVSSPARNMDVYLT
jgi:hypothetical protein